MSITGLPGQGPVRVGIPIADLTRRPVLRPGHSRRAARARRLRQGPVGRDLAAAGADLHARLPGGALAGGPRGRQAGRQQSPDQHPDRRVQDLRRLHQHRHRRPEDLGAVLPGDRAPKLLAKPGLCQAARPLEEPRRAQRRDRRDHRQRTSADWVERSTRPACRAGRSIRSTRCSPTRKSSMSVSPSRSRPRGRQEDDPGRPADDACRARRASSRSPPPGMGEHTDEILKEFGFAKRDRRRCGSARSV